MNTKLLNFFVLSGALASAPALADPPVAVEVVEDDADDLFARPRPAEAGGEAGVKKRADALFEELEREEAKRTGRRVRARVKTGDEVVEVEVLDEPAEDLVPAPPATPSTPTPPAPTSSQPALPPTGQAAPPPPAEVRTTPEKSWWDRPSYVSEGDLILWLEGGSWDGGGFGGFGGEGMASDHIGIRLSGTFGHFGHNSPGSGFSDNFNIFEGGVWAIQRDVNPDTAKEGNVHLTELSVTAHFLDKSMFDLYSTLGLAHLGYEVRFRDGTERGGAGYTRIGAGANLHFSRFFAGADFGWYPIELFRYTAEKVGRDDYDADFEEVNNRFEARRFTLTARVGMRF